MVLRVHGRARLGRRWDTEVLLRGVWRGRPLPVRSSMIVVPGLKLTPGSWLPPERDLEPQEAVWA
jgi:hypothetical protein